MPTPGPFPPPVVESGPAAGWYADPWAPHAQRYWDGRQWTSWTAAPDLADRAGEPTLPLAAALGALVVTVSSLVGSRFLLDALGRFEWPILVYVAISAVAGYGPMVAYCAWTARRWGSGKLGTDLGFRFRWADLGWGPLTWLTAVLCQVTVGVAIVALGVPITSNTESLDDLGGERGVLIALLVTAVLAAPVVEELVFRGVVLRGFRSVMGPVTAVALQAVLFGAAHVDPARGVGNVGLVIVLSAVGAVLGVAAVLFRRLGPAVLAHGILNGVVMCYVLLVS